MIGPSNIYFSTATILNWHTLLKNNAFKDILIGSLQALTKQKQLNYLHNNPLQKHWKLVDNPINYKYSSASYYENNIDEFGVLTDYYLA